MRLLGLCLFFISFTLTLVSSAFAEKVETQYVEPGELVSIDTTGFYPSTSGEIVIVEKPADALVRIVGRAIEFHPLELKNGTRRVIAIFGDDPESQLRIEFVVGFPPETDANDSYARIGAILFQLLVVAIFVEIALTLVFKGRFFLEHLEQTRGAKTSISIGASGFVVWAFDLYLFGDVVAAITGDVTESFVASVASGAITALVIAGGSGTIYELYTRLGIRPSHSNGSSGAQLQGKGALIVKLKRDKANPEESVQVELDDDFVGAIAPSEVTLGGRSGLPVDVGSYTLKITGNNRDGDPIETTRAIGIEPSKLTNIEVTL